MSETEQMPPKKTNKIPLIIFITLAVLGAIGQFSSSKLNSTDSSKNMETSSSSSTSWVPDGFISWNDDIAYKWVEKPSCDSDSVCAAIQVTSQKDCLNNLYGELLLQDKNYIQYSYTNDSQGTLAKGGIAELTFNFPPDQRFAHFKLSKISCI